MPLAMSSLCGAHDKNRNITNAGKKRDDFFDYMQSIELLSGLPSNPQANDCHFNVSETIV
jgi:hypothetical protein